MLFRKVQQLAQWVGFLTLAALALYGLVTLGSAQLSAAGVGSTATASVAAPGSAQAAMPANFNYQGFLRNPDNTLVTGSYDITIKIYDQAASGTALHTETFTSVAVRDGLFNVVLGDATAFPAHLFTAHSELYIGVQVGTDPELIPRQKVHPVPWALQATTLAPNATVDGIHLRGSSTIDRASIGEGQINTLNTGGGAGETRLQIGADTIEAKSSADGPNTLYMNYAGGDVKFGSAGSPGSVDIRGTLAVDGRKAIVIKRYQDLTLYNSPNIIDTGISINEYWCTVAGRDIANYTVPDGLSRHTYQTYRGGNATWEVETSVAQQNSAITLYSMDVVCYAWGLVDYQYAAVRQADPAAPAADAPTAPANQKSGE